MNYSTDQLTEITDFAEHLLTIDEIADVMEVDREIFRVHYETMPELKKAIIKGYRLAKYKINKSILEEAARGSVPAQKDALRILKIVKDE